MFADVSEVLAASIIIALPNYPSGLISGLREASPIIEPGLHCYNTLAEKRRNVSKYSAPILFPFTCVYINCSSTKV
jgi:hypothetical protein